MLPYNDYNTYLRSRYGCKVYKISLDAGFSCPNRDGTKSYEGCVYCSGGSGASYINSDQDIAGQLAARIEYLKKYNSTAKFIAYFQAFSNTYAPLDVLKKIYDTVTGFKEIVGISIGTRPDVIDCDKLKLISSYSGRYEVWMEYGLQSIHNRTLRNINRGHTFEDFKYALKITKERDIPVCAHVILGLPGETKEDMMRTAETLTELDVDGVKIHLLHILKGSPMEKLHQAGNIKLMEREEYVELVCDFLERLSPKIIIQRLTGEGDRTSHLAPKWALDKIQTIENIRETLSKRGACQGSRCQR